MSTSIVRAQSSAIHRNVCLQVFRAALLLSCIATGGISSVKRSAVQSAFSALREALSRSRTTDAALSTLCADALAICLRVRGWQDTIDLVMRAKAAFPAWFELVDIASDGGALKEISASQLRARKPILRERPGPQELMTALTSGPDYWRFWAGWYNTAVGGRSSFGVAIRHFRKIELLVAELSNVAWDGGPALINARALHIAKAERKNSENREGPQIAEVVVNLLESMTSPARHADIAQRLRADGHSILGSSLSSTLVEIVAEARITRLSRGLYASNSLAETLENSRRDQGKLKEPEAQTAYALQFEQDTDGKITVHLPLAGETLENTPDSQDRHREAFRISSEIVTTFDPASPGANTARELVAQVALYLEGLGRDLRSLRPSLVVTRGETLRQYLSVQESEESLTDLPPLSDRHLLALRRLVAAHNLLVGLDPELARRDNALFGPDVGNALVSPTEAQTIVHSAVLIGIAHVNVEYLLNEEAENVPKAAPVEARTSRRYSEGVRNFARAVLSLVSKSAKTLWKHKKIVAAGVGGTVATSVLAAKWIIANQTWFTKTFQDNPHMAEVVRQMMDFLRSLPLS